MTRNKLLIIGLLCCTVLWAEEMPKGYYNSADGKKDGELKKALGMMLNVDSVKRYTFGAGKTHTWGAFYDTDRDEEDNSVIDMYSAIKRYYTEQGASVSGIDIEHSLPNSWWGGPSVNYVAFCDLHLIVPADYSANRSKSNIPPGYVATDGITFDNEVMRNGMPKAVEGITYPDGLNKVFEPIDEYKGDFARMYFYTATRYHYVKWIMDSPSVDSYYAMQNDNYLSFQPWLQEILLRWHRLDPVSDKEVKRQDKVFEWQRNRNPYIDYPELVEYIWGNKQGQTVDFSQLTSTQVPFAEALDATGVTSDGFTANWIMPEGAGNTVLRVYHKEPIQLDSAYIVNLPSSSVRWVNATSIVDTTGLATSNNTRGVCVRLGTYYDKNLGHVYIANKIGEGTRLSISVAKYTDSEGTAEGHSLLVRVNQDTIDTIYFPDTDTLTYTYEMPVSNDTIDTIWLSQGTSKAPVLVRSIYLKQEQWGVQSVDEAGYPKTLWKEYNSYRVNLPMDETKTYYYTVQPQGYRTSNTIEVSMPTGIEDINANNTISQPIKVINNGEIMIIKGNKRYTILGQER